MFTVRFALPLVFVLPIFNCGGDRGDLCERAQRKLRRCTTDASGRDPALVSVPLSTATWDRGCPTARDRCAAHCILDASCEGIRRGISSTEPGSTEPAFDACVVACKEP